MKSGNQKKSEANKIQIQYQPINYQKEFHNDRYKFLFRAVFGGRGSGKTFAGTFEGISWAIFNPGSVGLIFEPKESMLKRILLCQTLGHSLFLGHSIQKHPLVDKFIKSDCC